MIKTCYGNIFNSKCEAIVVTVNCVGVMGKGIAKESKDRYPGNYQMYNNFCKRGLMRPGTCYTTMQRDEGFIINLATKDHWIDPSKLEWIQNGLQSLFVELHKHKIKSVAIPPLGCGNGGLNWYRDVKPMIIKALEESRVVNIWELEVELYEP